MNKFLATVLCMCFLFQNTVFAETNSAETLNDAQSIQAAYILSSEDNEKLDFMRAIGVLTEISEEDISQNRTISRGEFAKIAVSLFGNAYESYIAQESVYNDIEDDADYYNAVNLLRELNVVAGYNGSSFKPDNEIIMNEAIKILTCIMGYGIMAEENGGFPNGYLSAATQCGLLKNVTTNGVEDTLKISQLIPLIFNALEATPLMEIDFISNSMSYSLNYDANLLSVYFDIYKAKGIMTGNEYTSLLGKKKAGRDSVYIDGYEYLDINNIADGYLGYKVQFYYKDGDEQELVWLKPYNNSKIVEISTDDIATDLTTSYSIGYEDDKRSRVLQLKKDVSVIYNGVEYSGFDADLFKNADGKLTAISWESSSEFDVLIVEDYEYYVVDKVDVTNCIIKDKFDKILNIEEDIEDIVIVNESGTPVALEDFKEWDALAYISSVDGSYKKIIVIKRHLEGTIKLISHSSDSDRDRGSITIDDREYMISKEYPVNVISNQFSLDNLKAGNSGYFVLDANDRIILADMDGNSYQFGILERVVYEDFEEDVYARIYTSKGQHITAKLKEKVKIDNKSVKTSDFAGIVAALQKGDVISNVTETEKTDNPNWQDMLPENNVFQLIRYRIDEESGLLDRIDTGYHEAGSGEEGLRLFYDIDTSESRGAKFTYKSGTSLLSNVIAPENAFIFFVPSPLDISNRESYTVKNKSFFENDKSYTILPYGINADVNDTLDAMVMVDSYKININSSSLFIVSDICRTLKDDEVVTAVEGYKNKKLETIYAQDDNMFDGVGVGDIIQYGKNSSDFVEAVRIVYDCELRDLTDDGKAYLAETNTNAQRRYLCSDAYRLNNGLLNVSNVYIGDGKLERKTAWDIQNGDLLEKISISNFANKNGMYVYENKEVRVASSSDIKPYDMYGSDCSKIVAYTQYNEPIVMFIYNY